MEWTRHLPFSRSYLAIVAGVAVVVGVLAVFGQSSTLALAAAVLGLYVLHLFSNWQLASDQRKQWQTLREVERMLSDLGGAWEAGAAPGDEDLTAVGKRAGGPADAPDEPGVQEEPAAETGGGGGTLVEEDESVLVPRRYRLGTVAVVRRALTPEEVARVLAVQERHPDRQFGEIALDLDLLTGTQLEELLEIQDEGLYHPERIQRARRELKEYRRRKAQELGTAR